MFIKKYLFTLLALFIFSFTTYAGSNVLYQNTNKLLQNNTNIDGNTKSTQLYEEKMVLWE